MQEFAGKVALITGAANGIGKALATRCAQEKMSVVLADIDEEALQNICAELESEGATVLAVPTDVSQAAAVESLAKKTWSAFGGVHLLCNNAGICANASRPIWKGTLADWSWSLGVNIWGLIHGIRTFVPLMLEQEAESHIVNTASASGLICVPQFGIYQTTKHAVVAISETLYHELTLMQAPVKVSVLCPGAVKTEFLDGEHRHRPQDLQNTTDEIENNPINPQFDQILRQGVENGMEATAVAEHMFEALKTNQFYIFTHPELQFAIQLRFDDILQARNPSNAVSAAQS